MQIHLLRSLIVLCLAFVIVISACRRPKPEQAFPAYTVHLDVPPSILEDHKNILGLFDQIASDSLHFTSAALEKLDTLLPHHFKEEEISILPLLQLLSDTLAARQFTSSTNIGDLRKHLEVRIKHLNIEHQLIAAYLRELLSESPPERKADIIRLHNEIKRHAAVEEEIYFPAAALVLMYYNKN